MAKTNAARGTRDFLPADVRKREYVIGIIKQVYESYGFEPLETPAFENLETLTGKYGEEGGQLMFKILKRGDKLHEAVGELKKDPNTAGSSQQTVSRLSDLALRYDLTVPLARVVANYRNDLPKFFKRYQIQPVWRADRPARGRYREFYQCDVDAIGSSSVAVEAELISAACGVLGKLGFKDFIVRLNHRQLLSQMVADAGISNETEALVALDKLDKIGVDGVRKELIERGIFKTAADKFLALVGGSSSNEELNEIVALCTGLPVRIDPTLARGLSYYTGAIIEINVPDLAGSLAGGGRYDGLIGMFGKEQIPACGLSLGLERILVVMDERNMFPAEVAATSASDVMVTVSSDETLAESLKLANELRQKGLRVTLYPEADKFAKQLKYADQIKVPFVCVLGESEITEGTVTIKDMSSGEQKSIVRSDAAALLAAK
jgi:histidyl-tRNA synthetase